ncbi:MAG: hypothetical protein IT444_07510 [Phycisphaeraceae bacterium]|nr:hypothetical protein [Phycisphaeraceae bacterium]
MLRNLRDSMLRLHRSEQGAEGLEKFLIIGAIVLPLLFVLVVFRNKISEWVSGSYESVKSDADTPPTTPN